MYNETYINNDGKRDGGAEVTFLFATVDAMEPWNIGPCINFAEHHGFILKDTLYGIRLEENTGVIRPGAPEGPIPKPTYFVFMTGTFDDFKKFYGEEYDEKNIPTIPNKTAELLLAQYKNQDLINGI